jgi:hypothetical protein
MLAQAFDITHLKAVRLNHAQQGTAWNQFSVREDITTDKSDWPECLPDCDPAVEKCATWSQETPDLLEVFRQGR